MKAENSHIYGINNSNKNVSFKGYVGSKGEVGREFLKFYPPVYNKQEGDKIYLEICGVKRGKGHGEDGNEATVWVANHDNDATKPVVVGESADAFSANSSYLLSRSSDKLKAIFQNDNTALGYRFVVKDKNGNVKEYLTDATGTKTQNGDVYNVITKNQSAPPLSGPIYHMFFNSFAPTTTTKENMPNRNHFNDADTTIQNVIKKVHEGVLDPYKLILSTPVFGKDEVSSNGYWTTNPYQINAKIGTKDDFMDLQSALFDKGKAWIADGAFTSQGYQSPLLMDIFKHGKNSPFIDWLKVDSVPTFGVFPDRGQTDPETFKHIKYRLVNSPKNNSDYDSNKPTYIQFYDDRLVDGEQLSIENKNNLIERYAKHVPEIEGTNVKDPYEISTHQDSVQHYAFPIDPSDSIKINDLIASEGKSLDDLKGELDIEGSRKQGKKALFDFGTFVVSSKKGSASGAEFWDGQVDMVKMNLSGATNDKKNQAGMVQARNYLYGCATYWTKSTNNALVEHVSNLLSKNEDSAVSKISANFGIDKENIDTIKSNIKDDKYRFDVLNTGLGINSSDGKNDFILNEIVNFPLESIEFSPEITSVLISPYFSARPTQIEHQNEPKLNLVRGIYKGDNTVYPKFADSNKKMNELYLNQIYSSVIDVLHSIKTPEKIFEKDGKNLTDYGKFVARLVVPDIVKALIVASLYGDKYTIYNNTNGTVKYNTDKLRKASIPSLTQDTPKEEAEELIKKISNGVDKYSGTVKANITKVLEKRLSNTSLDNFKYAQALIDETGAGLNWRFDAAKDIADGNQLYNKNRTYDKVFGDSIDFWKNFVQNIKKENSNSYTIGEITDLYFFLHGDYTGLSGDDFEGKKKNAGALSDDKTAQRIFLEDTGMTTITNYTYMYGALPTLLSLNPDSYSDEGFGNMVSFTEKLGKFLNSGSLSSVNTSHMATGNHDKPRIMHYMALDMNIFTFDSDPKPSEQRISDFEDTIAYVTGLDKKSLKNKTHNFSSSAMAVGARFKGVIWGDNKFYWDQKYEKYLKDAISDLAQGKYIGHDKPDLRRANAFGNDDLRASLTNIMEYAIYLAEKDGNFSAENALMNDEQNIINSVMNKVLEKPMREELRIWQLMNAISGNATLYAGDEYAQTGFETPSKNVCVKNRGIVDHDIINEDPKIREYNKHMRAVANIHNIKGLSALAGGTTSSVFGVWCGEGWPGGDYSRCLVQNDDKGSLTFTVITPFNDNNKSRGEDNEDLKPKDSPRIELFNLDGILKSNASSTLTVGMKLGRVVYNKEKGSYEPDNKEYVIALEDGKYYIKSSDGTPIKLEGLANYFYKK